MAKIKFGVVGCGHIGKRHAEMILRNEESELVALMDIRQQKELAIEHFNVPFHNDLDNFLKSLSIEKEEFPPVVSICTPNGLHARLAIKALEAGCHVVIEKPIALYRKDAEHIKEVANKVKRRVFCVMQNRYSPPAQWLKELIENNVLGKIYLVQTNCLWNRDERYYKKGGWHGTKELDGGTLFTQFSHFVDILYWLFGNISYIQARFADFNHKELSEFEDTGLVTFDFENGGMGILTYSTAVYDQNQESSITIVAENGSLRIGGQYMNEVEYCHIKNYTMPELKPTNPGNDYGTYKGSAQNHHLVIQNVVDVLLRDEEKTTTIEEGIEVVSIIERIYSLK